MNRVLLVDDDPLALRVYCEGLLRQGFHVEVARDGLAGIKALRAQKPDVVVVDLLMPKFSGLEVLKYVRSEPSLSRLPVIVLSISELGEVERQAVAHGVQKELLKSDCNPAKLGRVVKEVLAAEPPAPAG